MALGAGKDLYESMAHFDKYIRQWDIYGQWLRCVQSRPRILSNREMPAYILNPILIHVSKHTDKLAGPVEPNTIT